MFLTKLFKVAPADERAGQQKKGVHGRQRPDKPSMADLCL
jgi:hypothetical protein